jgi:hypothetical protein
MNFAAYLRKMGHGALANIARDVGVSHTTVQRWRDGRAVPHKARLAKVIRACGGNVRLTDFHPWLKDVER